MLLLTICTIWLVSLAKLQSSNAQSYPGSWHLGCYTLQSNITRRTLLDVLEDSTGNRTSGNYANYSSGTPPPVYGSEHCRAIGLPYIAVLSRQQFYCIADAGFLQLAAVEDGEDGGTPCTERCSGGLLPCGSSDLQHVSLYNSLTVPRARVAKFDDPHLRFTYRKLEFKVTITFNHSYGLSMVNESEVDSLIPVSCSFGIQGDMVSRSGAVEERILSAGNSSLVSCSLEHVFTQEGAFNISVNIETSWQSLNASHTVTISHEVPARPDIVVNLLDHQLPTCVSNQHELDLTERRQTVKVYVDTPTPFKASVGQGVNLTTDWLFDNETRHISTVNSLTCAPRCYQSVATHTFTSLGVHEVSVNFSNPYGHITSTLFVIVVSKNIHGVTVTTSKNTLLMWEQARLQFSIVTSCRYVTYIEIDAGDGSTVRRLSAVDPVIANMDQLLRPKTNDGYRKVVSSYGVGCTLKFNTAASFTKKEGSFNLTWTVFNDDTVINSSEPLPYTVYSYIENLRFDGHLSYEVGMMARIVAYFGSVSYNHTTKWTLSNAVTGVRIVTMTGERADVFNHLMNETGTYALKCEVWNPAGARVEDQVTLMVMEPLGNLTTTSFNSTMLIATHHVVSFSAQLDSGLGAEYIWNVSSWGRAIPHVAPTNLGLRSKADVTFIQPGVYDVMVSARIGSSISPVVYVQKVEAYERITYVTCMMPRDNPSGCALNAYAQTGSNVSMEFYFPGETVTRNVTADGFVKVRPVRCAHTGLRMVRVVASNPVSSLEIKCPFLVLPRVGNINTRLTASYRMQLEATVLSEAERGVFLPVDAVYLWKYFSAEGQKERISVLPFTMIDNMAPKANVTACLQVFGLNGGVRRLPYTLYHHKDAVLEHQNVVRPSENATVHIRNAGSYGFTNVSLSLFSSTCAYNLPSATPATCYATSDNATVSTVSLSRGALTPLRSSIAAVQELPATIHITCPDSVIASRQSHTLISVDFGGADPAQFYAHYAWYKKGAPLTYTPHPYMLYEFTTEGPQNVTVSVSNHWGSVQASCLVRSTRPLIDLEIKPSTVHRLDPWWRLSRDSTVITAVIHGPRTLTNLTINFGDGEEMVYSGDSIGRLGWSFVDSVRNSITFRHNYRRDTQYKVHISASTEQTTLNATGLVYKSIDGVRPNLLGKRRGESYDVGESAFLMTTVEVGKHLSFKWFYEGSIEVFETAGNYSKAKATLSRPGKPNIVCKVYSPAYPEGIAVNFSGDVLVVVKPAKMQVHAFINKTEVSRGKLGIAPLNVTFRLRYWPGPDRSAVELWPNSIGSHLGGRTVGRCRERQLGMTICEAFISHIFNKIGVYNATMMLMVGNNAKYAYTSFEVHAPDTMVKFVDSAKLDGLTPVYYFPFGSTAVFNIELLTKDPLDESITYHWSFGDQFVTVVEGGSMTANMSHKYMATKEAGFTLSVTAMINSSINVGGIARVVIYKPIQRVELLVKGRGWNADNQGKLFFLPHELDQPLLLVINVYPEDNPFEVCYVVRGKLGLPSAITKTFLPENTDVEMYTYEKTLYNLGDRRDSHSKLVVSVMCRNVRPPGSPRSRNVYGEQLTVLQRYPIQSLGLRLSPRVKVDVKVGNNLTYECYGVFTSARYKLYLDGDLMPTGPKQANLTFLPTSERTYNLTCLADNEVGVKAVTLLLPVLNHTCQVELSIDHKYYSSTKTAVRPPTKWLSSEPIMLQARIKKRKCEHAMWEMRWNITETTDDGKEVPRDIGRADTDDLFLPPRTLTPGNYTAYFIVSIPGTSFVQYASERVTVTRSTFRAIISHGIARRIDLTIPQLVRLDGSQSYNPDCPKCGDLDFLWACHILHQRSTPCFKGSSTIQFGKGATVDVNTSELVSIGRQLGFQFILVVFKKEHSVLANQIWQHSGHGRRDLSIEAKCETCTDGPGLESSRDRSIVFKSRCSDTVASCEKVRYSWTIEEVRDFAKVQPPLERKCAPRLTYHVLTTPATTVGRPTTTGITTTSSTTPETSRGGPGEFGGPLNPTEVVNGGSREETPDRRDSVLSFPFAVEQGSGTSDERSSGEDSAGVSTTTSPLFDGLDYSGAHRYTDESSRQPITTTVAPASDKPVLLPDCTCAADLDRDVTNFKPTTFEEPRVPVHGLRHKTPEGFRFKNFIIKPDALKQMGTYVVQLTVHSSAHLGQSYYLLKTGDVPRSLRCYPSFADRGPDNLVRTWYSLSEHKGEELERGYDFQCNIKRNKYEGREDHEYKYAFEVYVERVPGELELVYRTYSNDQAGTQRLPAGYPQYDYKVNLQIHIVDVFGNRQINCPQAGEPLETKIYPKTFLNNSATDAIYDLVAWGDGSDWYDRDRTMGNVFTIRTNMLGVAEVLNRVAGVEKSKEETRKRTETRRILLFQLIQTPHRYMAEVEQKLVVLRAIVKMKSELCVNATVRSVDLLVNLVTSFMSFSARERPRDVDFSTAVVLNISGKLMECLSASRANLYGETNKLDDLISHMLGASMKSSALSPPNRVTKSLHGMTVVTDSYTDVKDEIISHGDVTFSVPAAFLRGLTNVRRCHSANLIEYADNPFKAGVDSIVSSLTLFDCDRNEVKDVKTDDAAGHVKFTLPLLYNHTLDTISDHSLKKADLNIHVIDVPCKLFPGKSLHVLVRFHAVDGHTFPVSALIRRSKPPTPHKGDYDKIQYMQNTESVLQLFFDDKDVGLAKKVYVALADANFNRGKPRDKQVTERNYTISSWWSECVYWDKSRQEWSGQGCSVTKETTLTVTHCSCNHLTAFASRREVIKMKVSRESVDTYFRMKHYPFTAVMVSLAVLFYVVLAIVCFVVDQRLPVQERVIAIQDNSPSDRQRYIITIETGSEPGSGTSAKVSLVLHGEEGMSETRELLAPADTNVFQTNSRDTFLLTLPGSLGPIWKVQLWHNNKGSTPSWYVKRVTVRDVESGQSYYFLCEMWLAVEESDGKVEREFMALDAHIGFGVVFKVKAPQYFNDYHLIRSLIYKPTYSHFSRLERLTCVFVGLLAHMALCTAYYHTNVEEYRGQYNLFDLSTHTVLVALAVNTVACPLMLALSMIFRRSSVGGRPIFRSKEHRKHKLPAKLGSGGGSTAPNEPPPPLAGSHSLLEQSILHWQSLQEWAQKQWEKRYQKALLAGEELSAVEMQMQEQVLTLASTQSGGGMFANRTDQSKIGSQSDVKQLLAQSDSESNSTSSHGSSSVRSFIKSRRWILPPWFRFIAWTLSFVCACVAAYTTAYYSIEFQEGRSVLWLQSIFVTFLFCNFVIQPVGILMKAVGTALVYRRDPTVLQHFPDRYEEDIEEIRIQFTNLSDEDEVTRATRARQRSRYLRFARPPQEKQLIAARKRTMKEKKLIRLGAEFMVLGLILFLLFFIVFCCDRDESFNLNNSIKSIIATNKITARHQAFLNISKPDEMWAWLERDLKELLFTDHSKNLGSSIIIGNATKIKQVRVQEEACVAKGYLPAWTMRDVCYPPYSGAASDTGGMVLGNKTIKYTEISGTEDAVLYGKLTDYSESGYEVLLPVTEPEYERALEMLRKEDWVDKKTRAVFVELTVYNLPTHLYCSVAALFEFAPTGQILVKLDVDSAKLYRYRSTKGYIVLTCELIFVFVYLCQLHFSIVTVMRLHKKYFCQIWNLLDCVYMILSLAYIVLYLYRFDIVEMLHNELRQTFHSTFVSVAPLVFWDRLMRLLLGLLLFIIVVKILKLFRYIKTFARLGNIYRRAARDIRAFAVFFLLLMIMYTNLGVALFRPVSYSFSDYWRGMMTVTGYMTGAVSYGEFQDLMPYWGAAYLALLSLTCSGLLTALMVAILSYHFRDFKQDPILAMDLKEAGKFLLRKLGRRTDRGNMKEEDDSNSQDLSPEFALAEMEYQVEELLFKMSALCDGVSLPTKPSMYYTTDSDGTITSPDDLHSMGGSRGVHDKMEGDHSLTRLLQLQGIGTGIQDGEQTYNRSQLELDVLRQLQLSHPRDTGINVWDDLRGASVERAFSDGAVSENDIPIHREEYKPVFHSYQGGQSDEDDEDSFISIPDESHTPFTPYPPSPPPQKRSKHKHKKHKDVKSDNKHCARAEVYELTEHPRPLTPDIAYHNDAYVSDVEVELELEFSPSPFRIGGFHKKSRSMTSKSQGAYHNQAYRDEEGDNCQQTNL